MKLIADSGSTKCDWIVVNKKGKILDRFQTTGINPLLLSEKKADSILRNSEAINRNKYSISEINFYGAGCGNNSIDKKLQKIFKRIFENAVNIWIYEDIVAAVHAATQDPALICILGTGSNCCYFDGENISQKTPSLGYLLGDEGSGNAIGKELLKFFFYRSMPKHLRISFQEEYQVELKFFLEKLYSDSFPNQYLASFAKFIFEHRNDPFIETLLEKNISEFLDLHLGRYVEELYRYPVHFIGSIAYYSQGMIKQLLLKRGCTVGRFIKNPVEHLVKIQDDHQNTI